MNRTAIAVVGFWALLQPATPAFDKRDLGDMVNAFGGLTFALASPLGALSGAMSGYATGDLVTLKCNNVSFSVPPQVTVTATAGAAVAVTLTTSGVTTGPLLAGGATQCSQVSTSGSGKGLQVGALVGPIAANGSGGSINLPVAIGDLPVCAAGTNVAPVPAGQAFQCSGVVLIAQ